MIATINHSVMHVITIRLHMMAVVGVGAKNVFDMGL